MSRRISVMAVLLAGLLLAPVLWAGEVYDSVMQELTRHDNRLPGSKAYHACLDHIEKTLKDAGLEPQRQIFDTLVTETVECRLAVDGVVIKSVYALAPNGPANNTTGGKTLSGPLVYLGNGSLAEMKGKPVEGCIAVLRFDSPNMLHVLSQGAQALVFVGDGTETQWQVRQQCLPGEAEIPRLFINKTDAEAQGLLTGEPGRKAEVKVTCRWKDVVGVNLWVELAGEPGATFKYKEEEAIVLTSIFDTYGIVPDKSPSVRMAANCALLAETLVELKDKPLKRSVFAVFLGSHYLMQDGARMFYFPVLRGRKGELKPRAEGYAKDLEESEARLAALNNEDFFGQDSPVLKDVITRVEKRLSGKVSTLNYELRVVRDQLLPLRRMDELLPEDQAQMDALLDEEAGIQSQRKVLNDMRRQFNDREITNQVLFAEIAAEERQVIEREIKDSQHLMEQNLTHQVLAERLAPRKIMGQFDIDFADPAGDWTLNMEAIGSQMFYHSLNRKWSQLKLGDYVKNFQSIAALNDSLGGAAAPEGGFFDAPATSLVFPGRFCTPSIRSMPTRVAHAMQAYGYQLCTVADPLNGDELPYRQSVDLSPLVPRLSAFVNALATDPSMSQACPLAEPNRHKQAVLHFQGEGGLRYLKFARGSEELAGVPEDGIVFCEARGTEEAPPVAGNSYCSASRIRASGHIFMPIMYSHLRIRPFGYRPDGAFQYIQRAHRWDSTRLFYGQGGVINAPLRPGGFEPLAATLVGGKTDANIFAYVYKLPDWFAFYTPDEDPFKLFAKAGLLLLGNSEDDPLGKGIPLDEFPLYTFNVLKQCAQDYLVLNNSRLQVLRDKSIVNDSLESLHADAEEHWQAAVDAREESDIPVAVAHEAFSAGISARVAPLLREVTNDMVRAVVLLLVLTLPFAFIMERLLISAKTIYGQVVGFVVFFICTFVLMYLVHPAFQIASSPMIIFLAFVIILLSSLVIKIVMSKFRKELRAMQGLSSSAHGAASDSSTAMAAVLIGISGMRNRPLKTFLTGLTIVLLTFAIVVFASFSPATGVGVEYIGKGDGANRIELHRHSSLGMPRMLAEALQGLYERDWRIFQREAFFANPGFIPEGATLIAYKPGSRKWERLQGMVAFDPEEMKHSEELAEAIPGFADYQGELPPLFLSARVVEQMGLAKGEEVRIGGKAFTFAGVFDASMLDQLEYMDKSKIMPPDFETSQMEMSQGEEQASATELSNDEFVDTTRFTYCSARSVGITLPGELSQLDRPQLLTAMNGIIMYAEDGADVEGTAEEIAKMFVGPVMAKSASGVNKYFFSTAMEAAGFSMVIVPLLLGGLIIFNSLLGSIVEREKEIFTYSAMGLSPPSVGALFFAESGVYAIMGGMGGYLVSQLVAKLVAFCGEMGWFVPPEMNFSSLSSVMTSFVVMGMVMISTIYPAIKAGRSANPGVARKWKMPAPVNGKIHFVFPFTVSADDMGGILAFIREHFENHGDSSLGNFAATNIELFKQDEGEGVGLRAHVSLAPFDLGVMQQFTMFSKPSEIEGIDEVVVQLDKVAGTDGAWLRGNRVFVADLREQFLLWRSLPISTVTHYRELSSKIDK